VEQDEKKMVMNPDYIPDPIFVNVGNPPDPHDDSCRWYGNGAECNDPDHDCPLHWLDCCLECRIVDQCKERCHEVRGR
jgi:hypothetical protein